MAYRNPTNHARRKWAVQVKEAAGNKCAFCGSSDRLESHHLKPLCDFPELELVVSNGICLCHKCHVKAHGGTFWGPAKGTIHQPLGKYSLEEIKAVQDFVSGFAAAIDAKMEHENTI